MEPKDRLKSIEAFRIYRRNYPHWELPGSIYFITFNCMNKFFLSDTAKDIVLSTIHFYDKKKYNLHAFNHGYPRALHIGAIIDKWKSFLQFGKYYSQY